MNHPHPSSRPRRDRLALLLLPFLLAGCVVVEDIRPSMTPPPAGVGVAARDPSSTPDVTLPGTTQPTATPEVRDGTREPDVTATPTASPSPTPTPPPTASPAPAPTASPDRSSRPTSTPSPAPTATPEPTRTARPSPTPAPTPRLRPRPKPGPFRMDVYRRNAFTSQYTAWYCVPAAMQTMINIMESGRPDRTRATQDRLYRLARRLSSDRLDGKGAEPIGWARGLERLGYGR
ncbi:MAG: hypothetical protein KF809_18430, partial [Chloroflexi bacterium]|nr:hypothetical protein [Chloroflexota bacterium]